MFKYFFLWRNSQIGSRHLIVVVSRSYTNTPGRTPLKEWSACRKDRYLHNRQQTNVYTLSGIQTRDPSNIEAADLRFRLHGHGVRLKQEVLRAKFQHSNLLWVCGTRHVLESSKKASV